MTGQQLKNSILQWAIQGKLVPQIASEGTAEDLLKEIRAEKSNTRKTNDIEFDSIDLDEVPFVIPVSWSWIRIGMICNVVRGGSPRPAGSPEFYDGEIPFMCVADITKDETMYVNSTNKTIKEAGLKKTRYVESGTLLLSNSGATLGVPKITTINTTFNDGIAAFLNLSKDIQAYLYWYFKSQTDILRQINQGTAQPNLNTEIIRSMLVPLPPLSEQKRIVSKIEELMPLVEQYGIAQEKLEALNNELPEKLKKSVLQEAIMGKLVPQDPKEGTADELLAEIRKEKEKLVKEGKLKKKDLEVKPIEEDEVPFEIPEGWRWCRLKDICKKIVDGDHNPPAGISSKSEYMMLSSKNINYDKLVDLDSVRYLDKDIFEIEDQRTQVTCGDILFTSVGTLGRSCIFEDQSLNICFQRSVSVISTFVYNQYLKRYLDSPFVQSFVTENATGTAQKGFYLNQLEKMIVPLPPYLEQKRIVAKMEEVFEEFRKTII